MDILGVEIDPSFIYQVSAISSSYGNVPRGLHAFKHYFTLSFKDGKTHDVCVFFDYFRSHTWGKEYEGKEFPIRKVREISRLSLAKIQKLRQDIVNAMNNPIK